MSESKIRYSTSFVPENEIIRNVKFIHNIMFIRYYYNTIIPTRYFVSENGIVFSEIIRDFIKPNKKNYLRLYVRINDKLKVVYRTPKSLAKQTFEHVNTLLNTNKKSK